MCTQGAVILPIRLWGSFPLTLPPIPFFYLLASRTSASCQAVICPTLQRAKASYMRFTLPFTSITPMHPSASKKLPPASQWQIFIRRPLRSFFLALRLAFKFACTARWVFCLPHQILSTSGARPSPALLTAVVAQHPANSTAHRLSNRH